MSYRILGATVLAVMLSVGAQAGAAQSLPRTEVPTAWLEFCTLDVAVIGENAAQVFVGMEPPVLNGNP